MLPKFIINVIIFSTVSIVCLQYAEEFRPYIGGKACPPQNFRIFYRKAKNNNSFTIGGHKKFDLCPPYLVTDRL